MAKKRQCKTKKKKAFTLIELLVVIAIIGILSVLVVAALGNARDRAKIAQMKNNVNTINNMVQMYMEKNGHTPASLADLSDYGNVPQNDSNTRYDYKEDDRDGTTYLIQGSYTAGGNTDYFYCNSKGCAEGQGTEQ